MVYKVTIGINEFVFSSWGQAEEFMHSALAAHVKEDKYDLVINVVREDEDDDF